MSMCDFYVNDFISLILLFSEIKWYHCVYWASLVCIQTSILVFEILHSNLVNRCIFYTLLILCRNRLICSYKRFLFKYHSKNHIIPWNLEVVKSLTWIKRTLLFCFFFCFNAGNTAKIKGFKTKKEMLQHLILSL